MVPALLTEFPWELNELVYEVCLQQSPGTVSTHWMQTFIRGLGKVLQCDAVSMALSRSPLNRSQNSRHPTPLTTITGSAIPLGCKVPGSGQKLSGYLKISG